MTPVEANAVLTAAALRDPRMKRTNAEEQADMATVWAGDLTDAGVTVEAAIAAVREHYLHSRNPVMIADIVALAADGAQPLEMRDLDREQIELGTGGKDLWQLIDEDQAEGVVRWGSAGE